MRITLRRLSRDGGLLAAGMALAVACVAVKAFASDAKTMVIVPSGEAKFVALDSTLTDGPELAVLWGDPENGPSATLLKLKKGESRLHSHSSDYHLVLLQGTMKHWAAAQREGDAKPLGPGSYWFQPGDQVHGGRCLTYECLMFVQWAGKRDSKAAESPAK